MSALLSHCLEATLSETRRVFDIDRYLVGPQSSDVQDRIVDAALESVRRYGVAKTTIDDIAAIAGCSRATIYRNFDGKLGLARSAIAREVSRAIETADATFMACESLSELVVAVFVEAHRIFRGHVVLQRVIAHEPELVIPALNGPQSPVQTLLGEYLRPHVKRHVGDHRLADSDSGRFADWVVRALLSYLLTPAPDIDFEDRDSTTAFVEMFFFGLVPGKPTGG